MLAHILQVNPLPLYRVTVQHQTIVQDKLNRHLALLRVVEFCCCEIAIPLTISS